MARRRHFAISALAASAFLVVASGAAVAVTGKGGQARGVMVPHNSTVLLSSEFAVFRAVHGVAGRSPRSEGAGGVVGATATPGGASLEMVISRLAQGGGFASRFGLTPANAVSVALSQSASAAVLPGSSGTCLIAQTPASADTGRATAGWEATCAPNAAIAANDGMSMTLNGKGGSYAWGLIPDGNSTVTVTTQGGTALSVPVVDNVYYATSRGGALTSVAFRGVTGVLTKRLLVR